MLVLTASPLLASTKDDLEQTQQELDQSRKTQAQLNEEKRKLEADLKALQEKLVVAAASLQKAESELAEEEQTLKILDGQLNAKNEALKASRKNLGALVNAALSLSRTPPEAMVFMPGDSTQMMKAARALKMASDSIRQETESIGLQITELQRIKQKVSAKRDAVASQKEALTAERKDLEAQLAQRKTLQAKLGERQKDESEKLAQLAKKAEDLQSLLSSVEKQQFERQHQKFRSFADAKGHIKSPVAGDVVTGFGESQGKNDTSKGLLIEARTGAEVTAPYDGEVVFTGPFLNYGQMVIIRHSGDFHTLLAGLAKIDVESGQFLLEGEPIGAMGEADSAHQLYVELRKNNQPIDPAAWISGLNKKK